MNNKGPVVVIEDDIDDQELFEEVFQKLNYDNELLFFTDGQEAFEFLNQATEQPFIILSDINVPKLNGFELRKKINTDAQLKTKSIPYVFLTTASDRKALIEAYNLPVQGFFLKQV